VIYSRRMPHSPRARRRLALTGALAAVTTLVLAGCGGQDQGQPIPTSTAQNILSRLDEVGRRVDARSCNSARDDSLPALRREVDGLPDNVDQRVRATLDDGVGRLGELVGTQCKQKTAQRRRLPTVTPIPQPVTPAPAEPRRETPSQPRTTPRRPTTGGTTGNTTGGTTARGSTTGGTTGGGTTGGGTTGGGTTGGGTTGKPGGGASGSLPGGQGPGIDVGGGSGTVGPASRGGAA
jgi:hypothetical protein